MMMNLLADAAGADPMISGNWLIAIVGAISTAIAAVIGKVQVDKAKRERTSTRIEDQPISVDFAAKMVTKDELDELETRIVTELKRLESALGNERSIARTANGNLHARIDKTVESMAEMKGELSQINQNLSRLLDLAVKRQPGR